jgi:hypothetical protein
MLIKRLQGLGLHRELLEDQKYRGLPMGERI